MSHNGLCKFFLKRSIGEEEVEVELEFLRYHDCYEELAAKIVIYFTS